MPEAHVHRIEENGIKRRRNRNAVNFANEYNDLAMLNVPIAAEDQQNKHYRWP